MRKTVTLAELMIAVTLLALIVLAAGAFNFASRGFLRSSERRVKVLNDISYVADHLARFILLATGDVNDTGIQASGTNLTLRTDVSPVTYLPRNTPTYADDTWVRYGINSSNLRFCPNFNIGAGTCSASWETLTNRFINLGSFGFSLTAGGVVNVTGLSLVYDPATYDSDNPDPRDNPIVTMTDSGGSSTLSFSSLTHSR